MKKNSGRNMLSFESDPETAEWLRRAAECLPDEPGRRGAPGKLGRYIRMVLDQHVAGQTVDLSRLEDEQRRLGQWWQGFPPVVRFLAGLIAEQLNEALENQTLEEAIRGTGLRMASGIPAGRDKASSPQTAAKPATSRRTGSR